MKSADKCLKLENMLSHTTQTRKDKYVEGLSKPQVSKVPL